MWLYATNTEETRGGCFFKNSCCFMSCLTFIQTPLCTPEKISCVQNITIEETQCLHECSGLIVNSYIKNEEPTDMDEILAPVLEDYAKYKGLTPFPPEIRGSS